MPSVIDIFLNLDEHMLAVIEYFGVWSYVMLFVVVFAETGLVVAPFLPGDSLLFVSGTLAGSGQLHLGLTYCLLLAAAIVGDTVNYWIGHKLGPQVFTKDKSIFFKKEYLEKTREFYDKHGGKAIIISRFLPILRTFAPFVAGIGKMNYTKFLFYNLIGGVIWVSLFTFAGFFFGSLPFIQENFHYAVVVIIGISVLPLIVEYLKYRRGEHLTKQQLKHATYKDMVKTIEKEHLD